MNLQSKEDIAKLLKTIAENEAIQKAEIPPTAHPTDIPGYHRLRITAAENIQKDRMVYRQYVEGHLGAMILFGPYDKQVEFAKKAESVGQTVTFDSDIMYQKMVASSFAMMGGVGTLTADQISLIFGEIRLLTRAELNIFRLRDPDFQWMMNRAWMKLQDLADGIRHSLFRTNGIKLTKAALLKAIFDSKYTNTIARTTTPVVIIGMKDEEVEPFTKTFNHGYTLIRLDTDTKITKELITQSFIELRDTIKSPKVLKENQN